MKGLMTMAAVASVLLVCGYARAAECGIVNGSFEDDGALDNIAVQDPNGWTVGPLADKFIGYVYLDWATDGQYNLTLYARWLRNFTLGETAAISQPVDLADVNDITFDLRLTTFAGTAWDPNVVVPVLMIDDEVVWTPDTNNPDIRGVYLDQRYTVEDTYRDNQPHTLAFGLMVKIDGQLFEQYYTDWDNFACTVYCNGGGLLEGDVNRDCNVDTGDLQLMAEQWLAPVDPDLRLNLSHIDDQQGFATIDFFDFAVYGDQWLGNYADFKQFVDQWLEQVDLGDPYNFFTEEDVPPAGIVNFHDFVIMAQDWMQTSLIPEEPEEPGNE